MLVADRFSTKVRSNIMQRIKSSNTLPERNFKKISKGYSRPKNMFGNPDFVNFSKREVVFIDGCFWHRCSLHFRMPKTNISYWKPKLERNVIRAEEVNFAYRLSGWKVVRIWEHELTKV